MATLGLVAGSGVLPRLVAAAARSAGHRVVLAAHVGETDPETAAAGDEVHWVRLGQLGRILGAFEAAGVQQVCFAGGIRKLRFFRDARPDAVALKVLARVPWARGDDALLRAIAGEFERAGMAVVAATEIAPSLLPPAGVLGRRRPSRAQRRDAALGLSVLETLGELDIGQAVVVKDGVVLAVEAAEGTDACIERGARLGGGAVVVVKAPKPGQDLRFDLPSVGPQTVARLADSGGGALAVVAGRTVVLEREAMLAQADAARIPVFAIEAAAPGMPSRGTGR
ncbi:MAG: LpxI family protein [Deltaproteobacteria bacterium]|nr:MAG: LpxI family protein [Deltaproteobacteria bacterium]